MRHLLSGLAIGLITFSLGVYAAMMFLSGPRPAAVSSPVAVKSAPPAPAARTTADMCARLWANREISDEDKAVMAAQGFISLMNYTDGAMGSADMAAPCVEATYEPEEDYRSRYDTLERRAYGISRLRKGGEKGWTVVFRYTERMGGARMKTGRAVTMDENFRNLRVEHCDFFLNKVGRKL